MPCRIEGYDKYRETTKTKIEPVPADFIQLLKAADELTHEMDVLREAYLALAEEKSVEEREALPEYKNILAAQISHRKEDLRRAEKSLKQKIIAADNAVERSEFVYQLARVTEADPMLPLEAQLGFDPDTV